MVVRIFSAPVGIPTTLVLSEVSYYISPLVKGLVHGISSATTKARPAVVVSSSNGNITADELLKIINDFSTYDDVYSRDFLTCLVIQTPPGVDLQSTLIVTIPGNSSYHHLNLQVYHAKAESEEALLPSGPYVVYKNGIHEVWRLYSDDLDSFEITIVPDPSDLAKFVVFEPLAQGGVWRNVAVPSRLYSKPSSEKPLAGLRVSVKDNFKVAGIKTTMTNRAFTELYPAETESAEYVKRLITLGAIIVGKTRMCSFAAGEEPTDQWIDFHCPFNPRADTYQSPGSSSSGAGASLAGYPWLDFSIGTDTAGSIRVPAANNGVYGLRPSHCSTPMDGIFPLARAFDTVGLLGRELGSIYNIASHTLSLADPKKLPTKILYPTDFFPLDNENHQAMIEGFVCILEKHLGVKRTAFSFIDRWSACPPYAANGKPLKEYLANSTFWQYYYDAYHEYGFFRDDYRRRFEKDAYVGPIVKFRWDAGAKITLQQRNQGEAELAIFRDWFQDNVLKPIADSLSDAILIMPEGKADPDYRDAPTQSPSILSILGENTVAMVLGLPHLVLPIGQIPYHSRVSGRVEHRPICASLLGAKGSDLMLIKLANDALQKAGWPTKIQTGRFAFPLGENERNVVDSSQ